MEELRHPDPTQMWPTLRAELTRARTYVQSLFMALMQPLGSINALMLSAEQTNSALIGWWVEIARLSSLIGIPGLGISAQVARF